MPTAVDAKRLLHCERPRTALDDSGLPCRPTEVARYGLVASYQPARVPKGFQRVLVRGFASRRAA